MDLRFCGYLLAATTLAGHACEAPMAAQIQQPFPLVEPGKLYLEDAVGCVFLINGDGAWSLIADLTGEDADIYLRDRRASGFNTVLINLTEHVLPATLPPVPTGTALSFALGTSALPTKPISGKPTGSCARHAISVSWSCTSLPVSAMAAGWHQEMTTSGEKSLGAHGNSSDSAMAASETSSGWKAATTTRRTGALSGRSQGESRKPTRMPCKTPTAHPKRRLWTTGGNSLGFPCFALPKRDHADWILELYTQPLLSQ
ncbi:DUF4038 domain-containing protein [Mesorhizobium sp. Cs1330R2N1]|uniref:DUF4038 domain-containing protein n=1 Tax=Mesorhizobium argentiipisi TaxID=3015175 RepID=A0ABU8K7J3_9HYPH